MVIKEVTLYKVKDFTIKGRRSGSQLRGRENEYLYDIYWNGKKLDRSFTTKREAQNFISDFVRKANRLIKKSDYWKEQDMKIRNEAFYGDYNGTAESFFTRDDINEFGFDVVDELAEFFNWMYGDLKSAFDLAGIWLDGNKLEMTVTCEYGDYDADITIDMRKIRKPSDLWKYKDIMVDKFKELINDLPY